MKRLALNGQPVEAMAAFDSLEKEFGGSAIFPDAVLLARKALPTIVPLVQHRVAQIKRRDDQDQERLRFAKKQVEDEAAALAFGVAARAGQKTTGKNPPVPVPAAVSGKGPDSQGSPKQFEYEQLVALLKREKTTADDAVVAMEKSGTKWIPIHALNDAAAKSLLTRIGVEMSRLQGLSVEKMRSSIAGAATVAAALANRDLAGAEKALADAKSDWAANELLNRLGARVAEAKAAAALAKGTAPK